MKSKSFVSQKFFALFMFVIPVGASLMSGCSDEGNRVIDSSEADVPALTAEQVQAAADAERANAGLID